MPAPLAHASPAAPAEAVLGRETVRQALARPEFNGRTDASWLADFIGWLAKLSARLSDWAAPHPTLAWASIGAFVLILAALTCHLIYLAMGSTLPWRGGPARTPPAREPC